MALQARVVLDSVSPHTGQRLTTFEVTMHHMIAKDFLTHRENSRNAASSRALPYAKFRNIVVSDPALPVFWGKYRPGMGADEEVAPNVRALCEQRILEHRDRAVELHEFLEAMQLSKEITNRYLEPWFWITYIISATSYHNFFRLRCHKDAQPEIQAAARWMQALYAQSRPVERTIHIPYVTDEEISTEPLDRLMKIATGRIARVSYLTHEGIRDLAEDVRLHDRLEVQPHASPFEHTAFAMPNVYGRRCGNFKGWCQYRHAIDWHENWDEADHLPMARDFMTVA